MMFFAVTAACSYGYSLKWDVDVSSAYGSTSEDTYYACLVAVKDGSYYVGARTALDSDGKTASQTTVLEEKLRAYDPGSDLASSSDDVWGALPVASGDYDWSGYSFHVLVVDSDYNQVYSTESYSDGSRSWSDLVSNNNVDVNVRPSRLITWNVTPEPSCALLFGLGAALMAIRRRKA